MQFVHAQQLTVGTYNIRYDNPKDTGNLWVERAPVVAALIRFHDFDIFGTQEGYKNQLDDLISALPYYSYAGVGRNDGKNEGEHSSIFYKKHQFNLLKKGDFWLSESPDKPGKGWDATCCNRICSWVYLEHKASKKKFFVFNAHYDHQGVVARKESSKLILQKIKAIAGKSPVILTGDLNGAHSSEWYQTIAASGVVKDSFTQAKFTYTNSGSFNGFGHTKNSKEIIDHIFITNHFTVSKWGVLTDTYSGKYPSDHFPVLAQLTIK
ncbi:MAG: endonuclease/exonuclease/phosphatase family protein [Bacteroidota bacterium]